MADKNLLTRQDELRKAVAKMDDNLTRWHGEVDDDVDYDEKLATLKEKRENVDEKLNAIDDASGDERESLREELDEAWDDLTAAYDDLLAPLESRKDKKPSSELLAGKTSAYTQSDDAI